MSADAPVARSKEVVGVPGVRSVVALLQYSRPGAAAMLGEAATALQVLYAPVLVGECGVGWRWLPELNAGLVIVGQGAEEAAHASVFMWGLAIGEQGPATAADIAQALEQPETYAKRLSGRFVLGRIDSHVVRLVSSPTLVHTLKKVTGRRGVCWATQGWAAHALAGASPRLNREAIAEYVNFDFVLGSEELLADTTVLPDAQVLDLDRNGPRQWSYYPLPDRVSHNEPATPALLRESLLASALAFANTPCLALGLTAGRDSTLLASVIDEAGGQAETFTLGESWWSDPRGARAVARTLGWSHHAVTPSRQSRQTWPRMAALSIWTEGMVTGSDLADANFRWPARDRVWLTGNGGEIGRMYYGHAHTTPHDWLDAISHDFQASMSPSAAENLIARLDQEFTALRALGRPTSDLLDLFYVTGRMGKWPARLLPNPHIRDVLLGYLQPAVVRTLLDLPANDRRTGAAFDIALSLRPPNLHQLAARASRPRQPRRQLHRWRFKQLDHRRTTELEQLLSALPPIIVTRDVMGEQWWQALLSAIPHDSSARRRAWNVVAVEALAQRLHGPAVA